MIFLDILLFVGGSVVLTFACYLAARAVLDPRSNDHTKDFSSSVVFRLSALHGLILALHHDARFLRHPGVLDRARHGFDRIVDHYRTPCASTRTKE